MSEANKKISQTSIRYALSIHMKYGEVLHLEDITKEEKDKYLNFARQDHATLLVEDKRTLRNLHSNDVAKISVVVYDAEQDKVSHTMKQMFYTESTLGRPLFKGIIKAFIWIAILGIIGFFGISMVEGGFLDVFLEMDKFVAAFDKGFDFAGTLFTVTAVVLVLLALLDMGLGVKSRYFRNQDGEEPAMTTRLSNAGLVVAFIVVIVVLKMVANGVLGALN